MSFLILLGLEFLSNVWNQMCLTVGKWSILNAPGALRCLNLIHIWGISLSLPSSQPKSEFQRRVICGNLGRCPNLTILYTVYCILQQKLINSFLHIFDYLGNAGPVLGISIKYAIRKFTLS